MMYHIYKTIVLLGRRDLQLLFLCDCDASTVLLSAKENELQCKRFAQIVVAFLL